MVKNIKNFMPYRIIWAGWVKEELVTETNENNDFTTLIPSSLHRIILCFIEHLHYPHGEGKIFIND